MNVYDRWKLDNCVSGFQLDKFCNNSNNVPKYFLKLCSVWAPGKRGSQDRGLDGMCPTPALQSVECQHLAGCDRRRPLQWWIQQFWEGNKRIINGALLPSPSGYRGSAFSVGLSGKMGKTSVNLRSAGGVPTLPPVCLQCPVPLVLFIF